MQVYVGKCRTYDLELIRGVITGGLEALGVTAGDFKGLVVALKPNLLMPAPVEKAVITDPVFFEAVVQIVLDAGGKPVLVENPAVHSLKRVIRKTPYQEIVDRYRLPVADVDQTGVLFNPHARKFRRFEISKAFFDCDVILNLPKFKTHGICYMTGAVKNLFGAFPGLDKSRWHMKIPVKEEFSEFLLDLNEAFLHGFDPPKTFLHIMDAIIGQEGEGPGPAGTPKPIGAVLLSRNPVAVDWAAVHLVGLDPGKTVTLTRSPDWDLGVANFDQIELLGHPLEALKPDHFTPTRSSIFADIMRGPITSRLFRDWFNEKPVPQKQRCTLCYQCLRICPAKAISKAPKKKKTPVYDYDKCIRCYCCMEICPESAIRLKKGLLQRVIRI